MAVGLLLIHHVDTLELLEQAEKNNVIFLGHGALQITPNLKMQFSGVAVW